MAVSTNNVEGMTSKRAFRTDSEHVRIAASLATAFCLVTVATNWHAFTSPLVEDGDMAADSLRARHGWAETTGVFSRWDFHHPGPVLLWMKWFGARIGDAAPLLSPHGGQMLVNTALAATAVALLAVVLRAATRSDLVVFVAFPLATLTAAGTHAVPWAPSTAHWFVLLSIAGIGAIRLGWAWGLPVAVAAGLAVVHLHLILAPAGVAMIAAAVSAWWLTPSTAGRRSMVSTVLVAVPFIVPMAVALTTGQSHWGSYLETRSRDPRSSTLRSWIVGLDVLGESVSPIDRLSPWHTALGDAARWVNVGIMILVSAVGAAVIVRRRFAPEAVVAMVGLGWLAYLLAVSRLTFISPTIGGPIVAPAVLLPAVALGQSRPAMPVVYSVGSAAFMIGLMLNVNFGRVAGPTGVAESAMADFRSQVSRDARLVIDHQPDMSYVSAAAMLLLADREGVDACVRERRWPYWTDANICDDLRPSDVVIRFADRSSYSFVN